MEAAYRDAGLGADPQRDGQCPRPPSDLAREGGGLPAGSPVLPRGLGPVLGAAAAGALQPGPVAGHLQPGGQHRGGGVSASDGGRLELSTDLREVITLTQGPC